jgi:hypothetical protein
MSAILDCMDQSMWKKLFVVGETSNPTLDSTYLILDELNLDLLSHQPLFDFAWNFYQELWVCRL